MFPAGAVRPRLLALLGFDISEFINRVKGPEHAHLRIVILRAKFDQRPAELSDRINEAFGRWDHSEGLRPVQVTHQPLARLRVSRVIALIERGRF